MRAALTCLFVPLAWTLACAAPAPVAPPATPPPQPTVAAVEPAAPDPAPIAGPPAPAGLHVVHDASSAVATAVICWSEGKEPAECEPPPCTEEGDCPEWPAIGVGVVPLVPGTLAPPLAPVAIANVPDVCAYVGARPQPGTIAATSPAREARAVPEVPPVIGLWVGAAPIGTLIAIDLDGDGKDEIVFESKVGDQALIGVLTGEGAQLTAADDRREPLPDDATYEQIEMYRLNESRSSLLGVTDVGLDGKFELVHAVDGYESYYVAIDALRGGKLVRLAAAGCAI